MAIDGELLEVVDDKKRKRMEERRKEEVMSAERAWQQWVIADMRCFSS